MQLAKILETVKPRTADDVWDEGYSDAKERRNPVNVWPSGTEFAAAYERGFLAGVLARGFTAQGLSA